MARLLNKRLAVFILVFIGVPAIILLVVFFSGLLSGDPRPYLKRADEYAQKEMWPQAWISIKTAMRYGAKKDPDAQYLYGRIALHQNPPAVPVARGAFQNALVLKPDFFDAQRDLAELHVGFRFWQEAKRDTDRLIEMNPSFGKGYLWSALTDLGLAQNEPIYSKRVPFYEAAAERLRTGIEKVPDMLDLYRLLAGTYKELDQTDKIDEVLDLAIANNPGVPESYVLKAGRLNELGRQDEASKVLQEGLKQVGDNSMLLMALGEVAISRRDPEAAKDFFTKAIKVDPKKTEAAYLRLCGLHRVENDSPGALAVVQQGLEALPESTALKAEEADIYLESRDLKKAQALIDELSKVLPDAAEVDFLRGKRALLDLRTRQAIAYLEQARSKNPTPQTLLLLGRAYLMAGEVGAAKRELESLVTSHPEYAAARRSLAEVQLRLHEYDDAARNATAVLQASPNDMGMRLLIAEARLAQGKPTAALKEAQTAVEQSKDDPRPLFLAARIYRSMNRNAEAEVALRRALNVGENKEQAYRELITFYRETDQAEKSKQILEEVRKVLPNSPVGLAAENPEQLEKELKARIEQGGSRVKDMTLLGRLYLTTDQADKGVETLQKVLDEAESGSPDWREAWQLLFMQYLGMNKYDKAADLTKRLKEADPQATELLFADPLMALSQNRLDEAVEQLTQVVKEHGTFSSAYYLLGQVLAAGRRWEEATAQLQRALDLRPDLVPARILLGRLYLRQGNYQAVLIEAGEALKFMPGYVPALELQALANAGQNLWDVAAKAREEIARIVPNEVGNLVELAALYLQRGDSKEAEKVFSQAYAIAPEDARVVLRFAEFYARSDRLPKGRELVDKYVNAHAKESGAYVLRGEFLATASGLDAAKADYEKAAELGPEDADPLVLLGDQYADRGRWNEAAEVYTRGAKRTKNGALAKKRLADVYMLQMKLDEAGAVIEEVLKADPKDAQAMVVAGRIASRRQDVEKAKALMEKALSVTPDYGEAKFWLAELYRALDPQKSLDMLREIDPSDGSFEKAMLLRSSINSQRGQFAEAAIDLRHLIDFRPGSVTGHRALADLYMTTNEPRQASVILERISRQTKDPALLVDLGNALLVQKRYDEALKRYEEARAQRPESPDALIGEARCLVALNRKPEALERVLHMLDQFPHETWPRLALAALYEGTGELDKAVELLRKGLLDRPDWDQGYVRLAMILGRMAQEAQGPEREQRLAEARQVLLEGLAKVPNSLDIRTSLAGMETAAGNHEAAKRVLDPVAAKFEQQYSLAPEALDKLRPFVSAIHLYTLILYYLGQVDDAVRWGTRLWNLDPLHAANANNLAWILATERKDYQRANELVRRSMQLVPNNPQVLDTAGWVAFLQDDYERATTYLLESIDRQDNSEARYHLGRVYEQRQRPEEALQEYEKALALGLRQKDKQDAEKRIEQLRKRPPA
jgi:tetratricopeptide (TPR) repeat protein